MRRWGALRAVALAGAAVVLLSGCLKLDVNLTVRSDDKLDGTVIVGVDKQVAALLPGGAANVGQLINNGGQPEISGAEDVKTAPFDDGKFVGQQITFKGAPLEEAGNTTGDLSIKHDGDVYRLTGTLDLNLGDLSNLPGNVAGSINPQEALANSVVHVQVNFPGRVQSSNGSNDGCSVSWEPKFGTTTDARRRGQGQRQLPRGAALVGLAALRPRAARADRRVHRHLPHPEEGARQGPQGRRDDRRRPMSRG